MMSKFKRAGSVERKTDRKLITVEAERWGPGVHYLYFCVSDTPHNKKVKTKKPPQKTNSPPDLPFLVLVLSVTPQQTLPPAGR